jgi:hypothetical protein
MQFMLLINLGAKGRDWRSLSEADQKAIAAGYQALDGYCLVEADSLERAIEIAAGIPAAGMGGAIEVRSFAQW